MKQGAIYCAVFTAAAFVANFFDSYSNMKCYIMAIKVKNVLICSMYDKVSNFSAKSVTRTNSGELITLVSSDLFLF
jgi:ABC-type multidrug transport system fused ATPase/permease subunit